MFGFSGVPGEFGWIVPVLAKKTSVLRASRVWFFAKGGIR